MLTDARWQKEQELMRSVFPAFRPFTTAIRFGFEGHLKGARSRQVYSVRLEADQATYPQMPPRVRINPPLGLNWIGEGENRRLCMERDWRPARSTFANTLLAVLRYLDQFDPLADPSDCPAGDGHGPNCRWTAHPWRSGVAF